MQMGLLMPFSASTGSRPATLLGEDNSSSVNRHRDHLALSSLTDDPLAGIRDSDQIHRLREKKDRFEERDPGDAVTNLIQDGGRSQLGLVYLMI